jgi:hypothetical protein
MFAVIGDPFDFGNDPAERLGVGIQALTASGRKVARGFDEVADGDGVLIIPGELGLVSLKGRIPSACLNSWYRAIGLQWG